MFTHLVIVPCHSIWKGGLLAGRDAKEWLLQSYQMEGDNHLCFIDHLLKAAKVLKEDQYALMIISGGKTCKEAGPISEADSYCKLLGEYTVAAISKSDYEERVLLEPFAKDSFENVLFLICRFYEVCGNYPSHITVCGFDFKRSRFVQLHLQLALKFEPTRVSYVGNYPMPKCDESQKELYYRVLKKGEEENASRYFRNDLYGIQPPLSTKKELRNPFNQRHEYALTNPCLRFLFERMAQADPDKLDFEKLQFPWNESFVAKKD